MIETAADGAVAIIFNDGTAFNLASDARMVLDEFVCDPDGASNSARLSLTRGMFNFIAGKVAKTGGLSIDTPFARIQQCRARRRDRVRDARRADLLGHPGYPGRDPG